MPVIYIDVLFFINFIIDSGLVLITGRLSGKSPHPARILLGGLLGGICATAVFFVNLPFWSSLPVKISISALMLFAAFYPFSAKGFLRLLSAFFVQSFLLGGTLSALFYFSGRPAVMSNSIYYFPFSTFQLLTLSVPLMTALAFYWKKSKNKLLSYGKYCRLTIFRGEKNLSLNGLIDSGCSLLDPLSGKPVIILSASLSEKLFDSETAILIKSNHLSDLLISGKFRLIPYSTISAEGGNMAAFSPDKCTIKTDKNEISCDCIIAFSPTFSGKNAIINPDIFIFGGVKNEL